MALAYWVRLVMIVSSSAVFSRFGISAKDSARCNFKNKILRVGQLLLASLILAVIVACGETQVNQLGTSSVLAVESCSANNNPHHILPAGNQDTDLQINGVNCVADGSVAQGIYVYRNVNIWNGGTLTFQDKQIDFHAHSILVEAGGTLQAGATSPIHGPLTIWLWGTATDGIPSITCLSGATCGVPQAVWNSNPNLPMKEISTKPCIPASTADPAYPLPNNDCFYQYEVLESNDIAGAYFGRKVLAVSAGGTLMLRGAKGIRMGTIETNPADSGTSWGRLTTDLHGGENSFTIDRAVPTWAPGDHIVVTTTDYLPSHTEELVIQNVVINGNTSTINVQTSVKYPHNGQTYDFSSVAADHPNTGPAPDPNVTNLPPHNIETRAIVALLTRSIIIASEGDMPQTDRTVDHFPATPGNFYGGSTIARQGFSAFEVQGVEFYQLAQGGSIGHYPVHFHMDRSVPQPNTVTHFLGTYVADSSIVDSMTRFITVHATQGVTLARNVGYKSIGHGFYLEDATETNNRLYSNVAMSVQGALDNTATNPRMVPGILDLNNGNQGSQIPNAAPNYIYYSDVVNPSAFWIMNGWNDFEYNAAVGVGSCGACYWMPPAGLSGPSRYESWMGYAGMQKSPGLYGAVPLMTFKGNSCSTAMNSLETVGATTECSGVVFGPGMSDSTKLYSVPNPNSVPQDDYPIETDSRNKTTLCNSAYQSDCSLAPPCTGNGPNLTGCAATVLDHYTTSFNWAQTNYAAVWLRAWWYLLDNSAITDVQNAGLTFISGGGYTRSDAAQGYWSVLKNSILVGNTQPIVNGDLPANPYASNAGPFNPGGLNCAYGPTYCISVQDGITFQVSNFGVNQRLFNIYDGPASQYNNIYSDVHATTIGTLADCKPGDNNPNGNCISQTWMNAYRFGVLQSPPTNQKTNNCVLPNAAIAWKQPNGFYYPPAFNSDNLVFNNVDIRHFVIEPLYLPGSFIENTPAIQDRYCTWDHNMFSASFTDIDRQTELTDNDGSLTGLTSNDTQNTPTSGPTISVTQGTFFNAPLITDQCSTGQLPPDPVTSNGAGATATTSPYEYLTTAIVAQCAVNGGPCSGNWANVCSDPGCYGVPLYRQTVTPTELQAIQSAPNDLTKRPSIRMMGQNNAQRSTLTLNHAQYYLDTTVPGVNQTPPPGSGLPQRLTVFQPNQNYYVFFLFATNSTRQTYSLYIGAGLSQSQAKAAITPARVTTPDDSFPMTPDPSGTWATFNSYDATTGVLTVNVDLSEAADLEPQNRGAFCQPTSFCSWNPAANSCGCKPGSGCTDDQICSYGTKDIDCPVAGCYAFNIAMPAGFATAPPTQPILPPLPIAFDDADPPYFHQGTVTFANAPESVAGECHYPAPPTPQQGQSKLKQ